MDNRGYIKNHAEMAESSSILTNNSSASLKIIAKIVSYLFHPLFIPVYLYLFSTYAQSIEYAGLQPLTKDLMLPRFIIMYVVFPLVTVLLAKGLGFLDSIYLRTQKERIIPYITCGIYYFWMSYVLRTQDQLPNELIIMTMSVFLASSIGLIANIYMKISMHTMSAGILLSYIFLVNTRIADPSPLYLSIALLVAGLIATSRLLLGSHNSKEIYAGFLVGTLSFIISIWADGILP